MVIIEIEVVAGIRKFPNTFQGSRANICENGKPIGIEGKQRRLRISEEMYGREKIVSLPPDGLASFNPRHGVNGENREKESSRELRLSYRLKRHLRARIQPCLYVSGRFLLNFSSSTSIPVGRCRELFNFRYNLNRNSRLITLRRRRRGRNCVASRRHAAETINRFRGSR